MVFDITGGYAWAIGLSGAFSLVGALSIVLLESTRKQLIPNWPEMETTPAPGAAQVVPAGMAQADSSPASGD
jgi:hypothetical protein